VPIVKEGRVTMNEPAKKGGDRKIGKKRIGCLQGKCAQEERKGRNIKKNRSKAYSCSRRLERSRGAGGNLFQEGVRKGFM